MYMETAQCRIQVTDARDLVIQYGAIFKLQFHTLGKL